MDNDRPVTQVEDDKHGLAKNAYENTIRDLNRTIYNLYIRINKLIEENNELSELRKSEHKSES
jgi:uncharacterized protein YjcR